MYLFISFLFYGIKLLLKIYRHAKKHGNIWGALHLSDMLNNSCGQKYDTVYGNRKNILFVVEKSLANINCLLDCLLACVFALH